MAPVCMFVLWATYNVVSCSTYVAPKPYVGPKSYECPCMGLLFPVCVCVCVWLHMFMSQLVTS